MAMGYVKDFLDPRLAGDVLLPWPGGWNAVIEGSCSRLNLAWSAIRCRALGGTEE